MTKLSNLEAMVREIKQEPRTKESTEEKIPIVLEACGAKEE